MGSTRLEVEKFKSLLKSMQQLSYDSMEMLRKELHDVKSSTQNDGDYLRAQLQELSSTWSRIEDESKTNEREIIQRLTENHEQELNYVKKVLLNKEAEIESLKSENNDMNETLTEKIQFIQNESTSNEELKLRLKNLEEAVANATQEREKAIAEMRDKLNHEHRTEIESLRCRFKLMTSMEQSPSETSLEKIDRPDLIELVNHESILLQTKENLEQEKVAAVQAAVERERSRLETKYFSSSSPKSPMTQTQDMYRRILDEKERQIDNLVERENILAKENMKLKETLQSVADSSASDDEMTNIKTQFDNLHIINMKLQKDLETEKTKRLEMEKSCILLKS